MDAGRVGDPLTLVRAAHLRYPEAVLLGHAAARLTFWRSAPAGPVELATAVRHPPDPRVQRVGRPVDPGWVTWVDDMPCTVPAFTASYLAGRDGGDAVDRALRAGVSLASILAAPLPRWPGAAERRSVLLDSRDEPWSQGERLLHRLLRRAGIVGWRTNQSIRVRGRTYAGDVTFDRERVIVEVDGYAYHSDRRSFEYDRERQNALVAEGWQVLRYTWAMLNDRPEEVVAEIVDVLRVRRVAR